MSDGIYYWRCVKLGWDLKGGCGEYWNSVDRMWEVWLLTWGGGIGLRVV